MARSSGSLEDSEERVPSELTEQFAAAAEARVEEQDERVTVLCREHPEHAAVLWRWLAVLRSEAFGDDDDSVLLLGNPTNLGPWRVLRKLGQGGMGTVYVGEHEEDGRRAAIKVVRLDLLDQPRARERFRREVEALSRIEHPGICRVHEVGEEHGIPYMAMELLEGEDLGAKIARARGEGTSAGPEEIAHVVALFEKVARALAAAHRCGLVHRDIKPGNLFVTKEGEPVVLDFGLARDEAGESGLTLTREMPGTVEYMSPEQVAPRGRRVDHRTDIYSLGVSLYECLVRRLPLSGRSRQEVFEKILRVEPRRVRRVNGAVSRDLSLVVEKAMEKEPSRRYQNALELAEDLSRVRSGKRVVARGAGPAQRTWRWMRRNPLATLLVGAVSLGLCVALVLLGSRNRALTREVEARDVATSALSRFELLANVVRLREAKAAEARLWPAWPEKSIEMRRWLSEMGEPLAAALPGLKENLAGFGRARGQADEFLKDALARLVRGLECFVDPEKGELASVRERLAWAETLVRRTTVDCRSQWDEAIAAIRSSDGVRASKLYNGLTIVPQLDLVPLGMDPDSKLWEFGHPRSGALPRRDPATGRFAIDGESCLVFVLLPGGTFHAGAQREDPEQPNHDPGATTRDLPVASVTITPFFLSKYEMTQGQWRRLSRGQEPSSYRPAVWTMKESFTFAHPVEGLAFEACATLMSRAGLAPPSEEQWEYGCRAGTSTPWWTGATIESLAGAANLLDRTAYTLYADYRIDAEEPVLEDGYGAHAPVDSLRPNPFGLYHVHGNVSEWCSEFLSEGSGRSAGAADRPRSSRYRFTRGGSFLSDPSRARSTSRSAAQLQEVTVVLGVRPARPLRE